MLLSGKKSGKFLTPIREAPETQDTLDESSHVWPGARSIDRFEMAGSRGEVTNMCKRHVFHRGMRGVLILICGLGIRPRQLVIGVRA